MLRTVTVVAGLLSAAGGASAVVIELEDDGSTTLDQLIGNSFIVGDKEFTINSFFSADLLASDIGVTDLVFTGSNTFGFQLLFEFADANDDDTAVGFALDYDVDVLDSSNEVIVEAILQFNGTADGDGAFAEVNEDIFNGDTGALIDELLVIADGDLDPSERVLEDRLAINSLRSLNIAKDFQLFAPGPGASASASQIRQEFRQIPVPGSMGIMAVAGVVAARRRR